jgi:hypothetical protein
MDPESTILDLLTDKSPSKARDLMLAWSERRSASWADAALQAGARAASDGHRPQLRGQLRYQLGEMALAESARAAGVGAIPLRTMPPGGTFIVARTGRFGIVSLTVRHADLMPRRSMTRKLLSQPNDALDPQAELFSTRADPAVTELAYFGCLVAVPSRGDPSVPAELAFAVPNSALQSWISWIPLHRLHGQLQARVDGFTGVSPEVDTLPDLAFPKFRLPKRDEEDGA